MDKTLYIQEITDNIESLDSKTLKNLLSYIKYIKFQDQIEPTLEILGNKKMIEKVRKGLNEIENGEVMNWDSIKTKENEENYCYLMAEGTLAKDWDSEADKVWNKDCLENATTM